VGTWSTPTSAIGPPLPGASAPGVAVLLEVVNPWSLPPLGGALLGLGLGCGEGLLGLGQEHKAKGEASKAHIEPIHRIRQQQCIVGIYSGC
jgi:hypothetical protein